MKNDNIPAKRRMAQSMLRAYDDGRPVRTVAYPVQAIRFGKDVTILALGGEVVIDYDLRAKSEYPKSKLIVAGYSNDVMCYIPSNAFSARVAMKQWTAWSTTVSPGRSPRRWKKSSSTRFTR